MSRLWQPRETRLLSEWIVKTFPNDKVIYRVRLGQPPGWAKTSIDGGAPPEIYKIYQRWADAIIITPKELILIEAKIKPDPGVISQINLYEQLLPKTPELQEFMDLPTRKVLLMAQRDLDVEELARTQDIEIQYYSPPWVTDYLKEIHRYRERY